MAVTSHRARSLLAARRFGARLLVLLAFAVTPAARAADVPDGFLDVLVTDDLHGPMSFAFLPDGRALVVELVSANIQLIRGVAVTELGQVPNVGHGAERGLLGIAVDPAWPVRPYVYVNYNRTSPNQICISRLAVTGDLNATGDGSIAIDWASQYDVVSGLPDASAFHNGGALRFGPDEMLYVSLGDDTQLCPVQSLPVLVGKILRLDVRALPDGPGGPPPRASIAPADNPFSTSPDDDEKLVWALGVRNPFRFSIDSETGFLYVADVGQTSWEEISELATGGLNLGWPRYEGPAPFFECPGEDPILQWPIAAYDHGRAGEEAIMAGPVYRRRGAVSFPIEYEGDLFYSDFYHGELTRLHKGETGWAIADPVPGQNDPLAWGTGFESVSDYGVAPDGSLWYCNLYVGEMRRIVPEVLVSSVPSRSDLPQRRAVYDVQGRRVDRPEAGGIYFGRGRRTVVLP